MRFFERAEVKHALAYLRLIATPIDDGAFLRIVNFPPRGIGARTLETLADTARAQGTSLWEAAAAGGKPGGKAHASLAAFTGLIDAMRTATAGLPLPEAVEHVNAASGLLAHYGKEKDGQERLDNLDELVNAAGSFLREADLAVDAPMLAPGTEGDGGATETGATDPLTAFLAHAALEAGETQAAEGRPALQLMTVHAAKGLEFHTVFVTGLEEGLFPHENSRNEYDGLEEERRLMYVAVTRARRRLYLTHAQSRMLHGQVALQHRVALPRRAAARARRLAVAAPAARQAARSTSIRRNGASAWRRSRPRAAMPRGAGPRDTGARLARRPERAPREIRHRHHHRCGRTRRRRARAGQFPRRRRQVAGARIREARGGLAPASLPSG